MSLLAKKNITMKEGRKRRRQSADDLPVGQEKKVRANDLPVVQREKLRALNLPVGQGEKSESRLFACAAKQ